MSKTTLWLHGTMDTLTFPYSTPIRHEVLGLVDVSDANASTNAIQENAHMNYLNWNAKVSTSFDTRTDWYLLRAVFELSLGSVIIERNKRTQTRRHRKIPQTVNSCCFKLCHYNFTSFSLSNVGEFFRSWFLQNVFNCSEKAKDNRHLEFTSFIQSKIKKLNVVVLLRWRNAQKMRDARTALLHYFECWLFFR